MNFQTIARLLYRIPQSLRLNARLPSGIMAAAPLHKAYQAAIARGWMFDWHDEDGETYCTLVDHEGDDIQTAILPHDADEPHPESVAAMLAHLNLFEIQDYHKRPTPRPRRRNAR